MLVEAHRNNVPQNEFDDEERILAQIGFAEPYRLTVKSYSQMSILSQVTLQWTDRRKAGLSI